MDDYLIKSITINLEPTSYQRIMRALEVIQDEFVEMEIRALEAEKKLANLEKSLREQEEGIAP